MLLSYTVNLKGFAKPITRSTNAFATTFCEFSPMGCFTEIIDFWNLRVGRASKITVFVPPEKQVKCDGFRGGSEKNSNVSILYRDLLNFAQFEVSPP